MSGGNHDRPAFQRMIRDAKSRRFDAVICEAIDRLCRNLSRVAKLYDQLTFYGIRIQTLQHDAITPMHIGLLGTMSQMLLGDIRTKTRRGLRAVAKGRWSAGGLCYGYRVAAGEHGRRGGRTVEAAEASVIVRIFEQYAAGLSAQALRTRAERGGNSRPSGWRLGALGNQRRPLEGHPASSTTSCTSVA